MKQIDMRFDTTILKKIVGNNFEKYVADPFVYTPSVTQIVGLYIDGNVYKLTNIQETVDYFGEMEDEAVLKLEECRDYDIHSCFEEVKQICTPVNAVVKSIILINENQKVSREGELLHDVWLTRGIVFRLAEHEISFMKDSVPFSEEIEIQKGYNLIEKYSLPSEFLEGWDEDLNPECIREIITIE